MASHYAREPCQGNRLGLHYSRFQQKQKNYLFKINQLRVAIKQKSRFFGANPRRRVSRGGATRGPSSNGTENLGKG